MTGRALVAGASGLVGHAAAERFADAGGWDVVAVSRRRVDIPGVRWRPLDLLDAAACRAAISELDGITHVVYAALQEQPGLFAGWTDDELIDRNAQMARNLLGPLVAAAPELEHISLLHGTKAYGLHHPDLGTAGVHMPLRERDPLRQHRNFYFEQEQYLRDLQRAGAGFRLTTFRPTFIYGTAAGANMNPLLPIVAYGVMLRERGEPLHFPGAFGDLIREAVDASLLADALVWATEAPDVDGEAFNVTNGDVFTWDGVWPVIAGSLGMEVGEQRPTLLAEWIPRHAEWWAAPAHRVDRGHVGTPRDIVDHIGGNSLVYADLVLGSTIHLAGAPRPDVIVNSTVKLRQAGFAGCLDTADMFARLVDRVLRTWRLPPR